jgi:xanthine dehydrogenase accessory factor
MAARATRLAEFFKANDPVVRVEVAQALGSTPRESGAWMLVSRDGLFGTIGGGQLELMAVTQARALSLQRLDAEGVRDTSERIRKEDAALPQVYVFGAGHVGKALAAALSPLPVRTILVETRQNELDAATADVDKQLAAMPESLVREAPPGAAFVVLTHDHALDFLIVQQALGRTDAAYIGMIGSKTKRATYHSWHREHGGDPADCARLVCPIGGSAVADKRPQVIAALVAAEITTALFAGR